MTRSKPPSSKSRKAKSGASKSSKKKAAAPQATEAKATGVKATKAKAAAPAKAAAAPASKAREYKLTPPQSTELHPVPRSAAHKSSALKMRAAKPSLPKLSSIVPFVIFGFFALILLFALHGKPEIVQPPLELDSAAPAIDLPMLNDETDRFTSAAWRGRPYILNFFASWCPDCHAEHEELMTLAAAHLPLVGISFKDSPDKLTAYLDHAGNPYIAVANGDKGTAASDWHVNGIPETFIIDARGTIRWHYAGVLTDRIVTEELMPAWEATQPRHR